MDKCICCIALIAIGLAVLSIGIYMEWTGGMEGYTVRPMNECNIQGVGAPAPMNACRKQFIGNVAPMRNIRMVLD